MGMVQIQEVGAAKLERVNQLLSGIGKNGDKAFKAVGAAMRRAADSGKSKGGELATSVYNISRGQFNSKGRIQVKMSGGSGGVASVQLIFAGQALPLLEFHPSGHQQGDVTVAVKRGAAHPLPHAWLGNGYGLGVWERTGTSRFPIEQKYGPGTGQMMREPSVAQGTAEHIMEVFSTRVEHEIWRILCGM